MAKKNGARFTAPTAAKKPRNTLISRGAILNFLRPGLH